MGRMADTTCLHLPGRSTSQKFTPGMAIIGDHGDHAAHADHSGHEDDVPPAFLGVAGADDPGAAIQPHVAGLVRIQDAGVHRGRWVGPLFAMVIFFYGGLPFLQMAAPEIRNRRPGMMTLISLAISVAFVYSVFAVFVAPDSGFFWEMATLIDIMLLGHWIEMRSVRQASGAFQELAKLMPDTAERFSGGDGGSTRQPAQNDDLVLVRPGASVPADGVVEDGHSDVNEAMITGESKPVEKIPATRSSAARSTGMAACACGDRDGR